MEAYWNLIRVLRFSEFPSLQVHMSANLSWAFTYPPFSSSRDTPIGWNLGLHSTHSSICMRSHIRLCRPTSHTAHHRRPSCTQGTMLSIETLVRGNATAEAGISPTIKGDRTIIRRGAQIRRDTRSTRRRDLRRGSPSAQPADAPPILQFGRRPARRDDRRKGDVEQ